MKRTVFIFSLIINASVIPLYAQSNLVLNPSFENYYDTSVIGYASFAFGFVSSWSDPNYGSSDIFVPESGGAYTTPPVMDFGFEYPHSGYCYAGFLFYEAPPSPNYELVQASLSTALQAGKTYAIESFVSLAEYSLCISNLGFYFSDTLITEHTGSRILVTPQYENPSSNMITIHEGWQRITGNYTAHGGEQFLSIGNFQPYSMSNTDSCSIWNESYLLIDDVAVYDTSKVDTIHLCMNDSVELGGIWRHNEGLYTDIIGGLDVRFYIKPRPYSTNLTIVEKPFVAGDSVRVSLVQKGGIDSGSLVQNFLWIKSDTLIDVPMYNIYGCDSTVRYICGTNIGVEAVGSNELNAFRLFPNPANDFMQITINKNDPNSYSISIIDITGKEIISQSISNAPIDVSLLTNGMYFVKLLNSKTGKLVGTEKFVKE